MIIEQPLPQLKLHNLYHWTDYVHGEMLTKNEAALRAYRDRANRCGVLTDTHEYTKRFLDGIIAKQWMLGK